MTKKEFAVIAVAIKAAYPASKVMADEPSMNFWYQMLRDLDYKITENAVMEYTTTHTFPPSIAEIRQLSLDRYKPAIPSFDEAWGTVQKAIGAYGSYHPQEAFAMLDDMTAAVVKNMGWTRLCQSENMTADRANFREAYETKAKEATNNRLLPPFVAQEKDRIRKVAGQLIQERTPPKIEYDHAPEQMQITEEEQEIRKWKLEELRKGLESGKGENERDYTGNGKGVSG